MDSDMRLPLITAVAAGAAAFSADGAALQPLENVEAFAEALIMHDFAFAQEVQRLDDLGVGRHVHQMLVCSAAISSTMSAIGSPVTANMLVEKGTPFGSAGNTP